MSLRIGAAVGAATLVAGAAFTVVALADDDVEQDAAVNAAGVDEPGTEAPAADTDAEDEFFASEELTDEELRSRRAQAEQERDTALSAGVRTSQAQGSDIIEEPEEDEEEAAEPPVFTGDARSVALEMVLAQGWAESEFSGCLEPLWEKESNWNHTAQNPSSGAYGIPQALPGDKMASHGDDWRTNPATQIAWGLDYIKGRYGTPCGAWSHSQANGWY
ncbi:lytic transglycosylase domain-containing protein [Nocardiopsis sp. FIRDI 009]|uniref:aggregation-promoting factor C-terminal-like domain-containing protein n=1 Tax=Nocardiopsis sp. FIRDI 009 TaxID=714197 RepID=UPI0018E4FBFA|nr:lytic transglycosylase domain-containing protein [Nocardiopsis sp. FIRDI 009]